MKRILAVACVLILSAQVLADDKSSPTGTWKYTANVQGNEIEVTLKLKADGEKLTGTISVVDMESKIEDGKFKDGEVTFKVVREMGDTKFIIKYKAKVMGDTMKGKRERDLNGEKTTVDFEAKRSK